MTRVEHEIGEYTASTIKYLAAIQKVKEYLFEKKNIGLITSFDTTCADCHDNVTHLIGAFFMFLTGEKVYEEVLCPALAHLPHTNQLIPLVTCSDLDYTGVRRQYIVRLFPGSYYFGYKDVWINREDVSELTEFLRNTQGDIWRHSDGSGKGAW